MADKDKDVDCVALLSVANNDLAVRLHQKLCSEDGNLFFSPFSISLAMSMLFRGTRGTAATEIRKVLGFDAVDLPTDHVHASFGKLLQVLTEVQDAYTLAVGNAIVCHKNFELLPDYKSDLQNVYRALSLEADFVKESDAAMEQINNWVKEATRNMIPKILDTLDPSTVMIILNAVYFKGFWLHKFDPERTRDLPFYNKGLDDGVKNVPMMSIRKKFRFAEHEKWKALELAYKGGDMSMIFLLPNGKAGLAELERELKPNFIEVIKEDMWETEVIVTLPKLRLEYSKSLNDVFQELGLHSVFQTGADFSGLSDSRGLSVSDIIHKAVLDVNEEGSEAAAVTAVMKVLGCCMVKQPTPEFRADHPFLFVIYDNKNDLILFMGRVNEL